MNYYKSNFATEIRKNISINSIVAQFLFQIRKKNIDNNFFFENKLLNN
jgi:hypothetical protein